MSSTTQLYYFTDIFGGFCLHCDWTVESDRKQLGERDGEGSGNNVVSESNPGLQVYGMVLFPLNHGKSELRNFRPDVKNGLPSCL